MGSSLLCQESVCFNLQNFVEATASLKAVVPFCISFQTIDWYTEIVSELPITEMSFLLLTWCAIITILLKSFLSNVLRFDSFRSLFFWDFLALVQSCLNFPFHYLSIGLAKPPIFGLCWYCKFVLYTYGASLQHIAALVSQVEHEISDFTYARIIYELFNFWIASVCR